MTRTLAPSALLLIALGAAPAAQDHSGNYPAADIAAGSKIYQANCAQCHGATGIGVGGIDLRRGRLPRASTDDALAALVSSGIPGTGMPQFRFNAANGMLTFDEHPRLARAAFRTAFPRPLGECTTPAEVLGILGEMGDPERRNPDQLVVG